MLNSVDIMDFVNSRHNTDAYRSVGIVESVEILKSMDISWTLQTMFLLIF